MTVLKFIDEGHVKRVVYGPHIGDICLDRKKNLWTFFPKKESQTLPTLVEKTIDDRVKILNEGL